MPTFGLKLRGLSSLAAQIFVEESSWGDTILRGGEQGDDGGGGAVGGAGGGTGGGAGGL